MTSATAAREPDVIEQEIAPTLPSAVGGTVDVQVATARRFPRSITSFVRRATEMATLTPEIAASCVYAMPRDGKTIEGPSARLAEIVASAWGNLRIQAGASEHDERYVTARGEAWDVETNVAIGFEVKRRITNRNGQTYNDDMIVVTGNAAASIALRNAVFKAVPSPFWRPIYLKCRQVIAGDAKTFAARRDEMLKAFMVAGVTHERLCAGIGLKGVQDITLDHMATLVGILNALKEGEISVEEAFPEGGGMASPQPAQRKSQQNGTTQPAPASAAQAAPETPKPEPTRSSAGSTDAAAQIVNTVMSALDSTAETSKAPADAPAYIGAVATVDEKPAGTLITLNTGFKCATKNADLIAAAKSYAKSGEIADFVTRAPRTAGNAPILEEIQPITAE